MDILDEFNPYKTFWVKTYEKYIPLNISASTALV